MMNEIDLSRADLNLLVLFEVVFDERHVGRAGERLNLSPSAVSHGLGRLRRLLNDPLFLKTPKGVVPTGRALDLETPIREILTRVRSVIATAEPFDPARSSRRFTIGAPDGISAVILPAVMVEMRKSAPGVDISVRQILPRQARRLGERLWDATFSHLDAHEFDIAVFPVDDVPARFDERILYEEGFVIAMRQGHPYRSDPTLERYCGTGHIIVSLSHDDRGFIDDTLAQLGLSRRVALAVPNFMFALALVSQTDLLAALPRRLVALHSDRFDLASAEPPMPLRLFQIRAVTPKAALMDAGIAWLLDLLGRVAREPEKNA
jgi:DNA-binding transcriptional LysR family regulator